MEALIIIGLTFFALIAVLRLDWALFIVLATLPAYLLRFNLGPIPLTMLESMILIVFVVWLLKAKPWLRLKKTDWQQRRQNYPYHLEIIIILLSAWAGLAVAGFDNSALGVFKAYFIEPIMLYLVIINYGKGSSKKFLWPLAISAAIISLVAIFQQITGLFIFNDFWAQEASRRVTSVFAYPNAVGLYLGPIIFLLLGLFSLYPKRSNLINAGKKILLLLIITASLTAIFFARSEGALIALIGGLFIVAFLNSKRTRIIAVGASIIGIIILSLSAPAWQYFKQKASLMDLSGQIRRQQWKETMMMLEAGNLISGSGLSSYQEKVEPFHQEGIFVKNDDPDWYRKVVWDNDYKKQVWQPVEIYLYPHNIFLNFWTELGLLGLLIFLFLIGHYYYDAIVLLKTIDKSKRIFILSLIGAMSTLVIHGLVDVPYFKNDLSILFWLLIALLGILKLKHRKNI